jgi:hypothetical protein
MEKLKLKPQFAEVINNTDKVRYIEARFITQNEGK